MKKAFKEWALICRALASGRQTLVLRKGGIREEGGEFRPDHPAFLFFPTYFHQAPESVAPEARGMLEEMLREQPDSGVLRISHYAEVAEVIRVSSLEALLALRGMHVWSEAAAKERFHRWGEDAVLALVLRVYALPGPAILEMKPSYAGCKSWVELEDDVSVENSRAVLGEGEFARRRDAIRSALQI